MSKRNQFVRLLKAGSMFCCCYLFYIYFLTIHVRRIYRTDLRQIFRVGKTMHVDDQCEITLSILKGFGHDKQFLLILLLGVAGRRRLVAQPGGLT